MRSIRVIGLVTVRELRERGLSKSYLVSWLILALLIGAGLALPALFADGADEPTYRVGVVEPDSARTVDAARSVLRDSGRPGIIETSSFTDHQDATRALLEEQIDAVLVDVTASSYSASRRARQLERLLQQGALLARVEEMTASGEVSERVVELLSGQVLEVSLARPAVRRGCRDPAVPDRAGRLSSFSSWPS